MGRMYESQELIGTTYIFMEHEQINLEQSWNFQRTPGTNQWYWSSDSEKYAFIHKHTKAVFVKLKVSQYICS